MQAYVVVLLLAVVIVLSLLLVSLLLLVVLLVLPLPVLTSVAPVQLVHLFVLPGKSVFAPPVTKLNVVALVILLSFVVLVPVMVLLAMASMILL